MNCFQNNICKKEAQLTYEDHTVCSLARPLRQSPPKCQTVSGMDLVPCKILAKSIQQFRRRCIPNT